MKRINFTYTLLIKGCIIILFSGCTTLVSKYQLKWPEKHELCLLSNGEIKTIPNDVKEIADYKRWEINSEGVIDIVKTTDTGEYSQNLYMLLIQDRNTLLIKDRRYFGEAPAICTFSVDIKKEKNQLTYCGLPLSQFINKLPKLNKYNTSLRLRPDKNVKMDDIFPLLTALNKLKYKRAFVEIFNPESGWQYSNIYRINFEDWDTLLGEGKIIKK